jgi:hypothetical protein
MKSFIDWIEAMIVEHRLLTDDYEKEGDRELKDRCFWTAHTLIWVKQYLTENHPELFEDEMQSAMKKTLAKYNKALDKLKDK